MGLLTSYVYNGSVHIGDHHQGVPVLSQNLSRSIMEEKGFICMPLRERSVIHTHTHTHTRVLPKGFEGESFSLEFNSLKFGYMIHSVEVDLYSFKYLYTKIKYFEYFLPIH